MAPSAVLQGAVEVLQHGHDVLALAFAPDGKNLASSTLDGQVYFWDALEGSLQVGCSTVALAGLLSHWQKQQDHMSGCGLAPCIRSKEPCCASQCRRWCMQSYPTSVAVQAVAADFVMTAREPCNGRSIQHRVPACLFLQGTIEGRRDIKGGRLASDRRSAGNLDSGACFTSLTYSADGSFLLAGGSSKFVCLYDVADRVMLRRFQITHNR
jgi:WD40 repeat protein